MEKYVAVLVAFVLAATPILLADQIRETSEAKVEMAAVVDVDAVADVSAVAEAETAIEARDDQKAEPVIAAEIAVHTKPVSGLEPVGGLKPVTGATSDTEMETAGGVDSNLEPATSLVASAFEPGSAMESEWPFPGVSPNSVVVFYGESNNLMGTVIVEPPEVMPIETPSEPDVNENQADNEQPADNELPDEPNEPGAEVVDTDLVDVDLVDEPDDIDDEPAIDELDTPIAPYDAAEIDELDERDHPVQTRIESIIPSNDDRIDAPTEPEASDPFDASKWASSFSESWSDAPDSTVTFEMLGGEEAGGYRDYIVGWIDEAIVVEVYESVAESQLWTAITLYEDDIPQGGESAYRESFADAILSSVHAQGIQLDVMASKGLAHYILGILDTMRSSGDDKGLLEFVYNDILFSVGYESIGRVADCYIIF